MDHARVYDPERHSDAVIRIAYGYEMVGGELLDVDVYGAASEKMHDAAQHSVGFAFEASRVAMADAHEPGLTPDTYRITRLC